MWMMMVHTTAGLSPWATRDVELSHRSQVRLVRS